jgi:hypothetical protein
MTAGTTSVPNGMGGDACHEIQRYASPGGEIHPVAVRHAHNTGEADDAGGAHDVRALGERAVMLPLGA